jgi:hypothetical protein
MAFASLTIDLDARLASFESNLRRGADAAESHSKRIETAFAGAGKALVALGAVGALGSLATGLKDIVLNAAALDDFAEKTGASVEKLSQLQQVARISGVEFGGVTDLLVKMSRALSGADEESKGAGAALAKLGLNAAELRALDPADAFRKIAAALNEFKDGGSKAALVTDLLGKSAASMLPYIKDLGEETKVVTTVTALQAAQAEVLEKSLKRLGSESYNAKQAFLLGIVPAMNRVIEQFIEGKNAAGGLINAIVSLGTMNPFKSAGENLNQYRAELKATEAIKLDRLIALPSADVSGLDGKIAGLKSKIEFAKVLQRQEIDLTAGDTPNERARFGLGPQPLKTLDYVRPSSGGAGAGQGKTTSPFDTAVKQLEQEAIKVESLSRQFEVLRGIAAGHYGDLNPAQKTALENLAAIVDKTKEEEKVRKENTDAVKQMAIEAARMNKEAESLADKWRELADPTIAQNKRMAEGLKLLNDQRITIEQFNTGANERLNRLLNPELTDIEFLNKSLKEGDIRLEKYLELVKRLNPELQKTRDLGSDIFDKLKSGFDDAVLSGGKFGEVLKSLAVDIAKLVFRDSTKSLADGLKGVLGGIFGGGSKQPEQLGGPGFGESVAGSVATSAFGSLIKGLFGFAHGGEFAVGGSGGTDSQLVAFRASPNETVTVRTPSQQSAGGGGVTIIQNMTFGSDVNRSMLAAWAEATKRDTLAAVASSAGRGGAFSAALRGQ